MTDAQPWRIDPSWGMTCWRQAVARIVVWRAHTIGYTDLQVAHRLGVQGSYLNTLNYFARTGKGSPGPAVARIKQLADILDLPSEPLILATLMDTKPAEAMVLLAHMPNAPEQFANLFDRSKVYFDRRAARLLSKAR